MNITDWLPGRWMATAIASSGLCLMIQAPSQALQFNFSYEEGTSYEQMLGFEIAGSIWGSYLSDSATLNIHVGSSNGLPRNVVGGALPGMKAFQSYGQYHSRLRYDASFRSEDDKEANFFGGLQDHQDHHGNTYYKGRLEQNTWNIYNTSLTNANAKSVGMVNSHSQTLDGMIMMSDLSNSKYSWDYDFDRSGNIDKKSLDFLSVAVHEVGHVLGFVSVFDTVDKKEQNATQQENIERVRRTTTLDLFRHSEQTGEDIVELRAGKASYFSVDGGDTKIAEFARGNKNIGNGSDGYQASHWKHQKQGALGIMGPAIRLGERRDLAHLDLRAMDAIGWDVDIYTPSYNNHSCGYGYTYASGTCDNSNADIKIPTVDFSLLQSKAESNLAGRLGKSTSWLKNNKYSAADQLVSNQTDLLANMLAESDEYYQILNLGSSGWWQILNNLGYGGWWQEYITDDAYTQKAYFSTLETAETTDVPEPSLFIGLLSFVTLGLLGKPSRPKPQN